MGILLVLGRAIPFLAISSPGDVPRYPLKLPSLTKPEGGNQTRSVAEKDAMILYKTEAGITLTSVAKQPFSAHPFSFKPLRSPSWLHILTWG